MKEIKAGPNNHAALMTLDDGLFDIDDWAIEDRTGMRRLRGRLVGLGTSQRVDHSHGDIYSNGTQDSALTRRCTACRWSEIYIFETVGEPDLRKYCVYTLGPSTIPGEVTRSNVRWASSGFEVIELATVRRGERGTAFLPAAHARALAMAAEVDESIAEAYVNRAVA
jgi:hypothetical protein